MIEELEECSSRTIEYTDGCGGAVYYWCNKDNRQVNVFEDCPKCKEEA